MNVLREVTLHRVYQDNKRADRQLINERRRIIYSVQLTSHSTHRNETSYPYTATLRRLSHFP